MPLPEDAEVTGAVPAQPPTPPEPAGHPTGGSAGTSGGVGDSPPQESLPQLLLSLLRELPMLVSDRFELLSLDLRRASSALGQIIGLVVVLAILGVTAWLLIWAGVLVLLVMIGLPREAALLLGILINLLGIWFAIARIRGLVPKLLLSSIRRHLTLTPMPPMPPTPPAAPVSAASHSASDPAGAAVAAGSKA